MKKLLLLSIAFVFLLTSCGSKTKGELVGVQGKKWYPEKPYGMELIPSGSFIMGKSEEDVGKSSQCANQNRYRKIILYG